MHNTTLRDRISEEGKVRLMVIPIVVMLAVTMVVAGWQYEEEVDIDVEENPSELTIEHADEEGPGYNFGEGVNVLALTTVDNTSELKFEVNPIGITVLGDYERVHLELMAEGSFEEHPDLETFMFTVSEKEEKESPFNGVGFQSSHSQIDEGNLLPPDQRRSGVTLVNPNYTAFESFNVDSNEFTAETNLVWEIPPENMDEEFTLKLEAVLEGLSEDVTATVLLHIECGNE